MSIQTPLQNDPKCPDVQSRTGAEDQTVSEQRRRPAIKQKKHILIIFTCQASHKNTNMETPQI